MTVDAARPLSRRALVAGTLGAIGGALASGLVRPLPVAAATDHVSYRNDENATTVVDVYSGSGVAIRAESSSGIGIAAYHTGTGDGPALFAAGIHGDGVSAQSIYDRAVYGNSGYSHGVYGYADTSGTGAGTVGHSSASQSGVMGYSGINALPALSPATGVFGHSDVSWGGSTIGVRGVATPSKGIGVLGEATKATGATIGVKGTTASASDGNKGVYGLATGTTGFANGVWGEIASTSGNGVYGYAPAATGYTGGVSGESSSTGGVGVWGYSGSNSTGTMGVTGPDDPGPIVKTGLFGVATQASGQTRGVVGQTYSTDGVGITGVSGTPGLPTIYGNIGVHGLSAGRGVFGESPLAQGCTGTHRPVGACGARATPAPGSVARRPTGGAARSRARRRRSGSSPPLPRRIQRAANGATCSSTKSGASGSARAARPG